MPNKILIKDSKGYFLRKEMEQLSLKNILENLMVGGYSQELCNIIITEYNKTTKTIKE